MEVNQFAYQTQRQLEINGYNYNNGEKLADSIKNMVGKGQKFIKKVFPFVNAGINLKSGYEKGEEVSDLRTTQADRIDGKDNIRNEAIKTGAKGGGMLGSVLAGLLKLNPVSLYYTATEGYDPITEFGGYAGAEAGAFIGKVTANTIKKGVETAKEVSDTVSGTYDQAVKDTSKKIESAVETGKEINVKDTSKKIESAVETGKEIKDTVSGTYDQAVKDTSKKIEKAVEKGEKVKDTVVGTAKEAGKMVKNGYNSTVNNVADGIESAVETGKEIKDTVVAVATDNALTNFGDKAGSWIYNLLN